MGSWLGKSTTYFAKNAPNALIFAADLWDNAVIQADPHYNGSEENMAILRVGPLYDRFMSNLWEYLADIPNNRLTGVIPMKMDSFEALQILHRLNISPNLIYIDASHHYDGVYRDVDTCLTYFPNADIVGDDWDYPDVRRAVEDCAEKYNLKIHVNSNKCWTYSTEKIKNYAAIAAEEQRKKEEESKIIERGEKIRKMTPQQLMAEYREKKRLRKSEE